jgi:hypothetical protein
MKRWIWQIVIIGALALTPAVNALAIFYNSGTYGACEYNSCSITISSLGSVALNITPTSAGSCTTQNDNVTVTTYDDNGYTLTLADPTSNTNLTNGAATIPTTTGTFAVPIALAANKWGYRVDGQGGFGAGPTTAQNNVALNATKYAGLQPGNLSADTIRTTAVAAGSGSVTPVWYSVCANLSVVPGSYTNTVTYTAIANN